MTKDQIITTKDTPDTGIPYLQYSKYTYHDILLWLTADADTRTHDRLYKEKNSIVPLKSKP